MTEKPTSYQRSVSGYSISGNVVETLIVPWDTPTEVTDLSWTDDGIGLVTYSESFARGAFRGTAEKVPHRVSLVWSHDESWENIIGRGIEFVDADEGEIGRFKLVGDTAKARDMLGGMGLSVQFQDLLRDIGTELDGEDVIRTKVHLRHVAATPTPAYEDARVLAFRAQDAARKAQVEREQQAARDSVARTEQERELLAWVDQAVGSNPWAHLRG